MQVRLDDEVADELQRRCADSGRSASAEANVWLRRCFQLTPGQQSPAAVAHRRPASIGPVNAPGPMRPR